MKRILIIDEGHAGHLAQSRGLANALATRMEADTAILTVNLTLRGIFRPLLRLATSLASRGLPDWALRVAYDWSGNLGTEVADVIVTSGGQGLYFAVNLARRIGAPLVYCGDPAPLPAAWCDIVLSPGPITGHPHVIETGLLISGTSPGKVAGRGETYRVACQQGGGICLAALLVGGGSRSHHYTDADWDALIHGVNHLGERGWRWLVSTSRRTPDDVEKKLRAGMDARFLVKTVWWNEHPQRVMLDYLGAADFVLVTQDSLSMLSEAIAAGKPTIALAPADVRPSGYIEAILSAQTARRRMARLPIDALAGWKCSDESFDVVNVDLTIRYADQVATLLSAKCSSAPAG